MSNEAPLCQHIRSNGTKCGSPALKDNLFCYYHQRCRPVTIDYGRCHSDYSSSDVTLPVFDDAHSIQITLHRVTELILRHQIDQKDASLVLYALQLAMINLKRLELEEPKPEEVVTDVPPEPPSETEEEQEARRKAVHAEFEAAFPLDPKPNKHSDDDLLPGTIHACDARSERMHIPYNARPPISRTEPADSRTRRYLVISNRLSAGCEPSPGSV